MNRASWVGVAVGSFIVLNYEYDFFRKIRKILNNMAKTTCPYFCCINSRVVMYRFIFAQKEFFRWAFVDMGSYIGEDSRKAFIWLWSGTV